VFNGSKAEGRINQAYRKNIDRPAWVGYFCSVSGAIGPTGNPVRIGNEPVAVIGDKRRNNVTGRVEREGQKMPDHNSPGRRGDEDDPKVRRPA